MWHVISQSGGVTLVDLGTGTSFDIKTLAPDVDYTTLTNDNFLIKPSGNINTSNYASGQSYWDPNNGSQAYGVSSLLASLQLSYTASTGILNSYLSSSSRGGFVTYTSITRMLTASGSAAVHAYLIY